MDLVSRELGQIAYIFLTDEVRPMGGTYLPEFLSVIGERYTFTTRPDLSDAARPGGVKFENGIFRVGSEKIVVGGLTIYNDAIVVEAHHTDFSKAVIDDVRKLAVNLFEFREPRSAPIMVYESHVVVDFDLQINNLIRSFQAVSGLIRSSLKSTYDRDFQIDANLVGFAVDPTQLPALVSPYLKPEFSISRRLNRPYADNRYICSATLPSDTHTALLEEFEQAVLAGVEAT